MNRHDHTRRAESRIEKILNKSLGGNTKIGRRGHGQDMQHHGDSDIFFIVENASGAFFVATWVTLKR
jgi:hypothetical protein